VITEDNNYEVNNFLGLIGATVARPVFTFTFGYGALAFPVLLMTLGILMMIDRFDPQEFTRTTILGLLWAFFMAIVLSIPESFRTFGHSVNYYPSGLLGGLATDAVSRFLGNFALAFLSAIFFLILLMVTFHLPVSAVPIYIGQSLQKVYQSFPTSYKKILGPLYKALKAFLDKLGQVREKTQKIRGKTATTSSRENTLYGQGEASEIIDFAGEETPGVSPQPQPPHSASASAPPPPPGGVGGISEDLNKYEEDLIESDLKKLTDEVEEVETSSQQEQKIPSETYSLEDLEIEKIEKKAVEDNNYDKLVQKALKQYQMPPLDLFHEDEAESKVSREELMANADLLENTLGQFNVKAFVKKVIEGPVITLYAVRPAEGVKINQVVSLADDLALAMRAKGIRMIAPIPGEAAIGIEIPNRKPSTVYFKSIVSSEKFRNHQGQLALGMGKTIGGEVFCADLTRMPHLLIAGSTGSGKSVGINTIISSILCRVPPGDVKFVLIDPKKLELTLYSKLKDHYLAFCPDIDEIVITHPQNAVMILRSVINEMEERYDMLAKVGVRDIVSYNRKIELFEQTGKNSNGYRKLPYLIVIIDELADLILTAARDVEEPITRLAQMARAVGIHLIVATQRPSVDILTGLIKANFPTRIAYQVATRPDSKVILDMYGAEKLIGNGDMLFLPPGTGKPVRLQNPYISTDDIEALIQHIRRQPKFPPYELKLIRQKEEPSTEAAKKFQQDELFDKAKEIVIRHQMGSVSLLQRKLKIGYARAGRLMDELEEAGIVGPGQGSKAREVLVSSYNDDLK
jgi:S-DNA-T family DNA segregation ATPase FtsK/SpoIIIE